MIYYKKLDVINIVQIDRQLSRLTDNQLSEQSAGSVLSFPVVLIVLDIGPAYQEVIRALLLDIVSQVFASDAHFFTIHFLLPFQLLNLLLDDCLLLLLVTTRHVSDLYLSICISVSGKLTGN